MIERVIAAKKAAVHNRLGAHFWMQLRSTYTITDSNLGALAAKSNGQLVPPELIKALGSASTANVGARA